MSANRDYSPRIGIFGGTFDPPHVGHLVTAINVAAELDLDTVLMMVNNIPWQKVDTRQITPAADRVAMVAAAVQHTPRLDVGTHEIDAGGKSYTADTLVTLRESLPDGDLFVILGDDAAAGIHTWERADEVIAHSRLVVVDRPGDPVQLDPAIDWIRVEVPRLEVSSSDLRERCRDGRPLDYLVPEAVLEVVRERHLYGIGTNYEIGANAREAESSATPSRETGGTPGPVPSSTWQRPTTRSEEPR